MAKTSTGRKSKGRTGVTPAKDHDRIQDDPVSHPSHYASDGQFSFPEPECIMLTRLLDFNKRGWVEIKVHRTRKSDYGQWVCWRSGLGVLRCEFVWKRK